MIPTTVRVDSDARDRINALGAAVGVTSNELLARALAAYEGSAFWSDFQAAAAKLRVDPG